MFTSQTHLQVKPMRLYSSFEIVAVTDTMIVITDMDMGRTITNDADNVIAALQEILPKGIGCRQVYYRDTGLRYDRLLVGPDDQFGGFRSCTEQQHEFFKQFNSSPAMWTVYGDTYAGKDVQVVEGAHQT